MWVENQRSNTTQIKVWNWNYEGLKSEQQTGTHTFSAESNKGDAFSFDLVYVEFLGSDVSFGCVKLIEIMQLDRIWVVYLYQIT